ncbi:MAG: ABC transporter ATP-binding protein/permease [Oscillospiraceae bacterium]|nr:ABC transporter ATP-binding protein/permease [Oscillospiraceae bacterium]
MIKRLAAFVGENKKDALLTPVFVCLECVFEVLIPFLMANIIDKGVIVGDFGYTVKMGLVLALFAVLSVCCGISAARFSTNAASGFASNLRGALFHKVQEFSFSNIDKFSTSSIITRLTTDINNIMQAFVALLRIATRAPLMMIVSLVFAFSVNARLATIYLCAVPVLGVFVYCMFRKTFPMFQKVFKAYDGLNEVVQENLTGIRVVKSYVREEHEVNKFNKASNAIYTLFVKAERVMSFNMPGMQLAMYGCQILICWFGANMIVSHTMTTGQLSSIIAYSGMILASLMMLSMVLVMVSMAEASAKRAIEILDEQSDIVSPELAVTLVPDGSITFENVAFSYSGRADKNVLAGVNLEIKSGQTIGILGGTGSGKSTLVQMIPRLYDATEGTVKVGGINVKDYDVQALRDAVAMVLQKNELFSGTIKENLRWGNAEATDEEIIEACKLAQADEFVATMPDGYDTMIERGGTNVSGGQKQRLCIARALIKKPKILILDDSTSAVDTATEAAIREGFRSFIPDTTKLIIAQRISSVRDCDAIVVLDEGAISGIGTHDELMANNKIYREVYYSQQKGGED